MGQKGAVFTTSLPLRDLAAIFREAGESARGGMGKLLELGATMSGNSDTLGFYTPSFDSPFAAIEGSPDFAIGVNILKFNAGAQGNGTHVHMYVDDSGSERMVELFAKHGWLDGGRAARLADQFLRAFRAADPKLVVQESNL